MQDLTLSIVQFDPVWEDVEANLKRLTVLLKDNTADLIVLPEMFSTGFSMNVSKLAEPMYGPTMRWMLSLAVHQECTVAGSIIIEEAGKYYNRLIWATPFGTVRHYDKKHLFTMAQENRVYTAGKERRLMLCKGWSICPLICYDLRFPVWSRNFSFPRSKEYDLLLYIASWPHKRADHWSSLLKARAIENQSFVAGVNRIGTDGNDLYYSGDSVILDFKGNVLETSSEEEAVLTTTFKKEDLYQWRKQFPAWEDAGAFFLDYYDFKK